MSTSSVQGFGNEWTEGLPYSYQVSNARTHDSAILFIQKNPKRSELIPQKYIKNINFKQMKKSYLQAITLQPLDVKSVKVQIEVNKENIIEAYLQQKQTSSRKFTDDEWY